MPHWQAWGRCRFASVTLEDVLEIVAIEKPKGVIVQFGGQTPLKLSRELEAAGVNVRHRHFSTMPHGFITMTRLCRESKTTLAAIASEIQAMA